MKVTNNNNQNITRLCNLHVRNLKESGEWERLQQILLAKLLLVVEKDSSSSSWRDPFLEQAKETTRKSGGIVHVTIDQLVADLIPMGMATIPSHVQHDMMITIHQTLLQQQQQQQFPEEQE